MRFAINTTQNLFPIWCGPQKHGQLISQEYTNHINFLQIQQKEFLLQRVMRGNACGRKMRSLNYTVKITFIPTIREVCWLPWYSTEASVKKIISILLIIKK